MESSFSLRSYGWYGERAILNARSNWENGWYDEAFITYQHAIECLLKHLLSESGCTDKVLLQSHKLLRLAKSVIDDISNEDREVLKLLSQAYFQLRYPIEDEIEYELETLADKENKLMQQADDIAVKILELARETLKKSSDIRNRISMISLE